MKFAKDQISVEKILATPMAHGDCFCCKTELIAKCGEVRLHHWAHRRFQNCDHWWENETEWHREWKNRFSSEWQEVVKKDADSGERHIADIYNLAMDLVIEFQNSPINGIEIQARELFTSECSGC